MKEKSIKEEIVKEYFCPFGYFCVQTGGDVGNLIIYTTKDKNGETLYDCYELKGKRKQKKKPNLNCLVLRILNSIMDKKGFND